jgi:hypothetical protein
MIISTALIVLHELIIGLIRGVLKIIFVVIASIFWLFNKLFDLILGTNGSNKNFENITNFSDKVINLLKAGTGYVIFAVSYVLDIPETLIRMAINDTSLTNIPTHIHIFNNVTTAVNVQNRFNTVINPIMLALLDMRFCIDSITLENEVIDTIEGSTENTIAVTDEMLIIKNKAFGINTLHIMIANVTNANSAVYYENLMIVSANSLDEGVVHEFGHLSYLGHTNGASNIMKQRPRIAPFSVSEWQRAKFRG